MVPFSRLFIACCLLLATATQSWRIDGNTWPKKFKKSSKDAVTILGTGLDQNQLIFVECTNSAIRSCAVYTRGHDNCKFNLGDTKTADTMLNSARQLAKNRVIVVSSEADRLLQQSELRHTLITFIDIDKCVVTSNLRFNADDLFHVEYENGIDIISDMNMTSRYNADGHAALQKPKVFQVPTGDFRLYPVSIRWRSKGFFMRAINNTNDTISLIQDDGVEFKKLLELPNRSVQVEYVSEQLYTVCWRDGSETHCAQFDEFGTEKTRNKFDDPQGEVLFAVRNLRNGGYVRFSFNENNLKEIRVIGVYLDREPEEATYDIDATTKEIVLADFYANGGMFVVAYVTENGDNAFAMYKLPGKLAQPSVKQM